MQHQSRDDAARDARDEVLVLEVAQDVKLARSARRAAALNRRHVERYAVAVPPPLLSVRYRSVIGDAQSRILASANNARLHSAAYLLVRGRHCRRAVVASLVAEITASPCSLFLRSLARSPTRSQLVTTDYATADRPRSATHAEHRHTVRPGSGKRERHSREPVKGDGVGIDAHAQRCKR